MATTIPNVSNYPLPAPQRGDRTTFRTRADSKVAHDVTLFGEDGVSDGEMNDAIDAMNTVAGEVETAATNAAASESAAESARDIATATANATIYAAGTTYDAGDVVLDPGNDYTAYISQQGSNTGNTPNTDDGTWWKPVLSNLTLVESAYNQIADASLGTGTHTFNYSNGDMQQLTATGDITIAFSNFPTGKVAVFIIDAVNWGAHTITHPAGILFAAGTAPSYTASGTDRLMIIKDKDDVYGLSVIGQEIGTV